VDGGFGGFERLVLPHAGEVSVSENVHTYILTLLWVWAWQTHDSHLSHRAGLSGDRGAWASRDASPGYSERRNNVEARPSRLKKAPLG
jgi:hypothetical protein